MCHAAMLAAALLTGTVLGQTTRTTQPATAPDLDGLKKRADAVLQMDNVQARVHVQAIFDYAEALRQAGRAKDALTYYEEGLRRNAWALDHQMTYAELLMKHGDRQLALDRAELVVEAAEDDWLVVRALELLGRKGEADRTAPAIARPEGDGAVLVLVVVGDAPVLVFQQVRGMLEKELGIPVRLCSAAVAVPPPSREPLKEALKELRAQLRQDRDDADLRDALKAAGLTLADLDNDQVLMEFFPRLIAASAGEAVGRSAAAWLKRLAEEEPQWDAGQLVQATQKAVAPFERKNARFLGVTRLDICTEDTAFLFGLRIGEHGAMSCRRFMASFTDELPSRKRLIERTVKQCLSSTGYMFGLPMCSNPTCARAYPHSLTEHDAKQPHLCRVCRQAFAEAVGQAGPTSAPATRPADAK